MAKNSAKDAAAKLTADLLQLSATGITGVWTATVRLNCGGAIDVLTACEQRIKLSQELD